MPSTLVSGWESAGGFTNWRICFLTEINLTQSEADALLAMEKHRADATLYDYPILGGVIRVPLFSPDKRESFVLDVVREELAV